MKSGVARRVLFLVDRRALAAQAVRAFASFEPEPGLKFDQIYEVYSQRFRRDDFERGRGVRPQGAAGQLPDRARRDDLAFVYVCTIQRMAINLFGRDAVLRGRTKTAARTTPTDSTSPSTPSTCIIADECHRGYTSSELSVWRKTLDHFDAIKIGLTATPAAHTKAYFKDIVYRYEYERPSARAISSTTTWSASTPTSA